MPNFGNTPNPSGHLIAARQVQGASVYNIRLDKLGTVEDVMIDKATGRIAYAVVRCGGFLGLGDHNYPLPWEKLEYNHEMGGYIVDIDRATLQGGPSYTDEATAKAWGRDVYAHYGVDPFWDPNP
jgi:sporulation protein YlmC with PRC-barrel domain